MDRHAHGKHNARLGHLWAAAPTKPTRKGQSAQDIERHLEEQHEKFSKLWLADDPGTAEAWTNLFLELRQQALRNGKHKRWLAENSYRFKAANVRARLKTFKLRTSTGTDWLELRHLREAPDAVLEALGNVLRHFVEHLIGPEQSYMVILDLIPKKSEGFRTTATFASHWRLLTSILFQDFRDYDVQAAEEFDTASPGRRPSRMILQRNLESAAFRAGGQDFGLALWDVAGFFEHVTPPTTEQAIKLQAEQLLQPNLPVFGHPAERVVRLEEWM